MTEKFRLVFWLIPFFWHTESIAALQCLDLFTKEAYYQQEKKILLDVKTSSGLLRLNLGGTGEIPDVVNVNILLDPRHKKMNIENLIIADMRNMPFVDPASIDQMYCFGCPGTKDFFDSVVREAHRVLKIGGTIKITSNSFSSPWINSLNRYGFQIEHQNDRGVFARKISEVIPSNRRSE